jgi:hypothetical protein
VPSAPHSARRRRSQAIRRRTSLQLGATLGRTTTGVALCVQNDTCPNRNRHKLAVTDASFPDYGRQAVAACTREREVITERVDTMVKQTQMTKQALLAKYSDPTVRDHLFQILDLRAFLLHCVIRGGYKIPDDLNNAIVLTEYGDDVLREMGKKNVPIKEARLICFLECFHLDLLVDPELTKIDALAEAIGNQVRERNILLPFVHGPDLYNRASGLFLDERSYLGTRDTLRLLEESPIGVFQMGQWVSGPYGIVKSNGRRGFRPTLMLPLQHCHDVSCSALHRVRLSTDATAPVNEHQQVVRKILEAQSDDPSAFGEFLAELTDKPSEFYNDFNGSAVCVFVGAALSDEELRSLVADLADATSGSFREVAKQVGFEGKAKAWVVDLDRPQLLQLAWMATDAQLLSGLDRLVFDEVIHVPDGEVRDAPLFPDLRAGAFGVAPELSRLGVRLSSVADIAPLRLRRLVESVFSTSGVTTDESQRELDSKELNDAEELNWQLRGITGGVNLTARLDEYLRTESPESVIHRLVLTRRENVERSCRDLGLAWEPDERIDDAALVARLLWKLGFDSERVESLHQRFQSVQERMLHSARSASVSTIVDQETMRGLGANYFVSLEELLSDTLAFSVWTLTSDHWQSRRPFQYVPSEQRDLAFQDLTNWHAAECAGSEREPHQFNDKTTLFPLCEGFGVLARQLLSLLDSPEDHLRPEHEHPEYSGHTGLKLFPFKHSKIFLDLEPASQRSIVDLLSEVSRSLIEARVPDVRNEQLHFRRSSADMDRLIRALEAVQSAVTNLSAAGLIRTTFHPDRLEEDRWGRRTVYFSDRNGREIALGRPSAYSWLSLPALDAGQYLISCARYAEPNEILRVLLAEASDFTKLYENFPQRRQRSTREGDLGMDSKEGTGQRSPQQLTS